MFLHTSSIMCDSIDILDAIKVPYLWQHALYYCFIVTILLICIATGLS